MKQHCLPGGHLEHSPRLPLAPQLASSVLISFGCSPRAQPGISASWAGTWPLCKLSSQQGPWGAAGPDLLPLGRAAGLCLQLGELESSQLAVQICQLSVQVPRAAECLRDGWQRGALEPPKSWEIQDRLLGLLTLPADKPKAKQGACCSASKLARATLA